MRGRGEAEEARDAVLEVFSCEPVERESSIANSPCFRQRVCHALLELATAVLAAPRRGLASARTPSTASVTDLSVPEHANRQDPTAQDAQTDGHGSAKNT